MEKEKKAYEKRKLTWKKIIGICGALLLFWMPFKVLAAETTYVTYYEDGRTTLVIYVNDDSDKMLYANGTSLIFYDGKMYEDVVPFGEYNNADKRIYLSEELEDEDLRRVYVNTGGMDDTVYGDSYLTILNTEILGIYVNHITDATVYIDNSLVGLQRIENADGDVNYTLKNTNKFYGIECYDTVISSYDEDGGLIKGELNITLDNVNAGNGSVSSYGTVLGNTTISIKDSNITSIYPAHIAGCATKNAKVSLNVENSELETIAVATWGSFGNAGTIYGDVEVLVKDSNIELGICRYGTNRQGGITNTVTGKATVRVEGSVVRDINDRGGYANEESISENATVILKDAEVEDLVTNSVNIEGTVKYVRFTVNNLNFVNNATLISNQRENNGSNYIRNRISGTGTIKANVTETSQLIYFEGENPVAKGAKITIEPVYCEDGNYVPYTKNEKIGRAIEFRFSKNTNAISYLANFVCVNHELKELISSYFSEITVLDYCEQHSYVLARKSGEGNLMHHAGLYDKAADCTHEGIETYYCRNCDKFKYEKTKALGHNYEKIEVVKPTNTEKGYTIYECIRCKDSYHSDYVDAVVSLKAVKLDANNITLSKKSYNYNGKTHKPSVTVKVNGRTLKLGVDYSVSYKNNKNIGKATVTIKGKGNYTGTVTKQFTIKVKKGTKITVSKNKYEVTGDTTVKFTGTTSKSKTLTIPKTVKYGGKTFKVTAIASKALKGNKKVTTVTIGENVKKIGKSAFYGCKNLKKITFKSKNITEIGKDAFKKIKANATVKVPKSCYKQYKKMLQGAGAGKKIKIKKGE